MDIASMIVGALAGIIMGAVVMLLIRRKGTPRASGAAGKIMQALAGEGLASGRPSLLARSAQDDRKIAEAIYRMADGETIATAFFEDPASYGEDDPARALGQGYALLTRITCDEVCDADSLERARESMSELLPGARLVLVPMDETFTRLDGVFCKLADHTFLAFTTFRGPKAPEDNRSVVLSGESARALFDRYRALANRYRDRAVEEKKEPERPSAPEVPDEPEAPEEPKAFEEPQAPETPGAPEEPKVSEEPRAPEPARMFEETSAPEEPEVSEEPRAPEPARMFEETSAPEEPEVSEEPRVPEAPRMSEEASATEDPKAAEEPAGPAPTVDELREIRSALASAPPAPSEGAEAARETPEPRREADEDLWGPARPAVRAPELLPGLAPASAADPAPAASPSAPPQAPAPAPAPPPAAPPAEEAPPELAAPPGLEDPLKFLEGTWCLFEKREGRSDVVTATITGDGGYYVDGRQLYYLSNIEYNVTLNEISFIKVRTEGGVYGKEMLFVDGRDVLRGNGQGGIGHTLLYERQA